MTLITRFPLENLLGSNISLATVTGHTISTFIRSWSTSFLSGTLVSMGHWFSGNFKNSGPLNHLPLTSFAETPFVKSSATFIDVGQWN